MTNELNNSACITRGKNFEPCDISEILVPIGSDHYQFKFPGQYCICDPVSGNTSTGNGTPEIVYGKYEGDIDHIHGEPGKVLKTIEEYYAIFFPKGLKINNVGVEKYPSLRQIIVEGRFPFHTKEIRKLLEIEPPSILDYIGTREYDETFYQTKAPKIICFRKDNIAEDGMIVREPARPFQINPNEYLVI